MGLFILVWLLGTLIGYGMSFAYSQRNWPTIAEEDYLSDCLRCVVFSVCSSWMFAFITFMHGWDLHKHGLKLW